MASGTPSTAQLARILATLAARGLPDSHRIRRWKSGDQRDRGSGCARHDADPQRALRRATRGHDGLLRPDSAGRRDDRRDHRRSRHAVRGLSHDHDRVGGGSDRLSAGREQRPRPGHLPAYGARERAAHDRGPARRCSTAWHSRRAGRDPRGRRDPDHRPGGLASLPTRPSLGARAADLWRVLAPRGERPPFGPRPTNSSEREPRAA